MKRLAAIALLASASALGIAACSNEPAAKLVGTQVDNFLLVDQTGMAHSLKYDTQTPAIVLVSQVNGDEGSRAAAKALEALAAKHPNIVFKMINSSPTDTRETIAAEAKEQGLTLPVLDDEFQLIGDSLGVTKAGEAFAVDTKTWKVAYHGSVDGLEAALTEIAAGTPVTKAQTAVKGTKVEFADRANKAEFAKISYANDIAPILMKRCVDCHQPGGIGTWQMTNYETVKGFSGMIREAVRVDRMPPYDVDRHVGQFQNDENLTEAETKTLIHWIEAGAPRGEGDDPLVVGVTARAEWPLGKPDLVVDIPAYTIPAAGIVDYQMPAVASPLKEGRWLKATTFKAGQRQGVHHILAGWMPKVPANGRGFDWNVSMGGYAVGSESNFAPENWATWIPAGGAISFQMHYTPFGKEAVDNSKIGFYFGPEPELVKRQIVIADPSIEIQPNQARWHETAYVQFPAAVQVYATQIHAHYRGYASKLTAYLPDGTEKLLVNMPKYDFNWQREYIFQDLIDLPAGTKLVADYWYDNSVNNQTLAKDTLTDPTKTVPWGDQSFDEMLFTGVQFRWVDETAKVRRDDLQQQLEQSLIVTMADDNRDGELQEAELRTSGDEVGEVYGQFKQAFPQIDADKSGGLSFQEIGAAMKQMDEQARAQGRNPQVRSPT
ncbi:MAG: hypothetical protein Q8R02_19580 [Hyphomonadaceae bacterium]|nr:hypothetical protein [Hyphomonadaceae bacterium]